MKSSYFFIKDAGQLIGMLSINSSATQYQKLCQEILQLGGFSSLLTLQPGKSAPVPDHFSERFFGCFRIGRQYSGRAFCPVSEHLV